MKLKIASYNISGGFFDKNDTTEYLDKERAESVDNENVFEFFDGVIEKYNPDVIVGDFNVSNIMCLLKNTEKKYRRTINDITTIKGHRQDDILVKNN